MIATAIVAFSTVATANIACSALLCKTNPKNPWDDPDLDRKPKKLDPNPGVSRIPHGSLGTRRASPPSFSVPRMGPPKIR